jgi:hypothetical protein
MPDLLGYLFNSEKSTVFLPSNTGFSPLVHEVTEGSINDIREYLGYHNDQTKIYWGDWADKNIHYVLVEVFSKNIIYVNLKEPRSHLKKSNVNYFMRSFDVREEFGDYRAEEILKSGIDNKSLHVNFLSKVLNINLPALNGIFHVESIRYNLIFENGYLAEIVPSDGLGGYAKLWMGRNPALAGEYEEQAKYYWGDNISRVIKEVNAQADAYANTPNGFQNEYAELHRTQFGLIDFSMLMVCHYNWPITFAEFEIINYGRYLKVPHPEWEDVQHYHVGRFIYTFTPEGKYLSCYAF